MTQRERVTVRPSGPRAVQSEFDQKYYSRESLHGMHVLRDLIKMFYSSKRYIDQNGIQWTLCSLKDVLLIGCVIPTEPLATFNAKLDLAPNCVGRLVDHNNDDILTASNYAY